MSTSSLTPPKLSPDQTKYAQEDKLNQEQPTTPAMALDNNAAYLSQAIGTEQALDSKSASPTQVPTKANLSKRYLDAKKKKGQLQENESVSNQDEEDIQLSPNVNDPRTIQTQTSSSTGGSSLHPEDLNQTASTVKKVASPTSKPMPRPTANSKPVSKRPLAPANKKSCKQQPRWINAAPRITLTCTRIHQDQHQAKLELLKQLVADNKIKHIEQTAHGINAELNGNIIMHFPHSANEVHVHNVNQHNQHELLNLNKELGISEIDMSEMSNPEEQYQLYKQANQEGIALKGLFKELAKEFAHRYSHEIPGFFSKD